MIKRPRTVRRSRGAAEADELIHIASSLSISCTLVEDRFWQDKLTQLVEEILIDEDEDTLNSALDTLSKTDPQAWNELADIVEACTETHHVMIDQQDGQSVMFAIPLLAWSRFSIPSGPLGAERIESLRKHLAEQVFAKGTLFSLADFLFSPDQLPQGYCNTAKLSKMLATLSTENGTLICERASSAEPATFLTDTRYLLGAVTAPVGQALFRWQEEDGVRKDILSQWQKQGLQSLQSLFAGCAMESLTPLSYFAAWRESDRASRGYSLRATISFLQLLLNIEARQLTCVIAACHGRHLEEYRIGFIRRNEEPMLHGVVWPLLDGEDEHTDCVADIESILRDAGINDIVIHEHTFPMDQCDDCGNPLFPDLDGDLLHIETPESSDTPSPHLH
ncbi:DUF2863 family protein [Iodobacter fluviatilis]|uniref:Protein of uncharacterized function (DUF2863) n=1 Tax=Iodobacter fluviatilis TaxID=537 RepID=A0A377Q7I3_9NEIS|nr:DUF2863 family protein [Iodobacter fluviatilis]TCU88705.1 uncharacterized protein DUF2863 [Iodobacter fluviatilis]STQ91224.1 Protein of uncharacterised function (DUF2863) [Iodobacter fluviatilis]